MPNDKFLYEQLTEPYRPEWATQSYTQYDFLRAKFSAIYSGMKRYPPEMLNKMMKNPQDIFFSERTFQLWRALSLRTPKHLFRLQNEFFDTSRAIVDTMNLIDSQIDPGKGVVSYGTPEFLDTLTLGSNYFDVLPDIKLIHEELGRIHDITFKIENGTALTNGEKRSLCSALENVDLLTQFPPISKCQFFTTKVRTMVENVRKKYGVQLSGASQSVASTQPSGATLSQVAYPALPSVAPVKTLPKVQTPTQQPKKALIPFKPTEPQTRNPFKRFYNWVKSPSQGPAKS